MVGIVAISETLLPGVLDFILIDDLRSSQQENLLAIEAMPPLLASRCFACP
jgi:hypothetical protein